MGYLSVILLLAACSLNAGQPERFVESVLPSLAYGSSCWSSLNLQNLGNRPVTVEIQSHRASGALVPLVDHPQETVQVRSGERARYRLEIEGETGSAWVKVRELVPAPELSPVIAVSGTTECTIGNQLRTADREVTYPTRNPWLDADVRDMPGNLISLVNTSEHAARASLCYSSGDLYSDPGQRVSQLTPICSHSAEVQIAPFSARQFPIERESSTHFSMKTRGESIVLQMLHPVESSVKLYSVDSTIRFESEK